MAKRGRKKIPKPCDIEWENKECYICFKKIYQHQIFYAIGKDKSGVELYRHCKCKPSSILKPLKRKKK